MVRRSRSYIINAHPPIRHLYKRPDTIAKRMATKVQAQAVKLERSIEQATPIGATGDLRASTKAHVTVGPRNIHAEIVQDRHGLYVQKGTRPHMVSGYHLIDWIRFKGRGNPIQAAFALAQAIAKHGTKGYNYLREPIAKARATIPAALQSAAKLQVKSLLRGK